MKIPFGLVILVGGLLLGVYIMAVYLMPDVICKMVPPSPVETHMGQYNSQVLSDICAGIAGRL
ncbi:MAG: hypothetical protein ACREA1_02915 [Nitrosotalea sp.]